MNRAGRAVLGGVVLAGLAVRGWGAEAGAPVDWDAARQFWAFQRPTRHAAPAVKDAAWIRQPIDGFVLARHEREGLAPNPPATKRTLIRRVTFDLTGLPPTPEEVEAFVGDPYPGAYERLVARQLGSPHFGERWARMWLDVARYGEDQAHIVGNNKALFYPNAYRYRDWVIAALSADMPYDEFVRRQLAVDMMEGTTPPERVALGFIGLGPKYYNRGRLEVMADEWEDRVDTVSRGLLGLTTACARCHDHKYDPIVMEDYYALAGVFASTKMVNVRRDGKKLEKSKDKKKSKDNSPNDDTIHVVQEGEARDLHVFLRGNVENEGPVARRRFLRVLSEGEPVAFVKGSGRLELAEAIVDPANPLTARVFVNRVWEQMFGQGLVRTPSNFGRLGARPTHPALLDDLAVRFVENGWSLKTLVRELALSATYRQSSRLDPAKHAKDPANRLLWRRTPRRLAVEAWRDALLAVSGRLDARVGGASLDPAAPASQRRTVYAAVSRFELNPLLHLFDFPDPNVHSAQRSETNTPLQKLFVLNSPFMLRQAKALAARLTAEKGEDDRVRVMRAYRLLYARDATPEETEAALAFLHEPQAEGPPRWEQYAQVLLAANEMAYTN